LNIKGKFNKRIEELKNKSKLIKLLFSVIPYFLSFTAGIKISLLTWFIVNKLYLPIKEQIGISYFISVILIIPVVEELLKVGAFLIYKRKKHINYKDLSIKRIYIVLAAYGFQITEAFFYRSWGESIWWFRFIYPSHILFTFVSSYSLLIGIILHSIWNYVAVTMPDYIQLPFLFFLYIFFASVIYARRSDYHYIVNEKCNSCDSVTGDSEK